MATDQVNKTYNKLSHQVNELNKTLFELGMLKPELEILAQTWQQISMNLLHVVDDNI